MILNRCVQIKCIVCASMNDMSQSQDTPAPEAFSTVLRVGNNENGTRLDSFLAQHLSQFSRSDIARAIDAGYVLRNNMQAKRASRLTENDTIDVHIPADNYNPLEPCDLPLTLLYEDEHIAVIDKPSGLTVHPTHTTREPTVVNCLIHRYQNLPIYDDDFRQGIVHRLDKNTSGCLVVARTERAQKGMIQLFANRTVRKEYRALVAGIPRSDTFTITLPIRRHPTHRHKMTADDHEGRHAISHVTLIEKFSAPAALLAIRIETGRTHQIRVHLSHVQHPVIGDDLYGKATAPLAHIIGVERCMLHAFKISFPHPISHLPISIASPLPEDMVNACALLRAMPGAIHT